MTNDETLAWSMDIGGSTDDFLQIFGNEKAKPDILQSAGIDDGGMMHALGL